MKVGIIGVGNMGGAIAKSLAENGFELILANRSSKKLEPYKNYSNVEFGSNEEVAKLSDVLILGVKPNMYMDILKDIGKFLEGKIFISIAAGMKLSELERVLPSTKVFVAMPNTPAFVGESMTAFVPGTLVEESHIKIVEEILNGFGNSTMLDEKSFGGFGAAIGTLPAFISIFAEGIADGAVLCGVKRSEIYDYVAQTLMGTGKLLLDKKLHPAELKDMVTSPGGTTIEGVRVLEENAIRGALIDAVVAAYEKNKKMGG